LGILGILVLFGFLHPEKYLAIAIKEVEKVHPPRSTLGHLSVRRLSWKQENAIFNTVGAAVSPFEHIRAAFLNKLNKTFPFIRGNRSAIKMHFACTKLYQRCSH
jgi:hypothetical protein